MSETLVDKLREAKEMAELTKGLKKEEKVNALLAIRMLNTGYELGKIDTLQDIVKASKN